VVLSVFGFNFRTATVEQREPFQIQRKDQGDATLSYQRISRVDEALVLATCNRVEFYRVNISKGDPDREIVEFYKNLGVENPERILKLGYRHVGAGAARHLFRVISGMDSLVVGEDQIRGQVKDAYSAACSVGGPGKVIHKLLHHGFRVSKKVRHETELGSGIRSLPGAAVSLLCKENVKGKKAVIVGANETTEVVISHLSRLGVSQTIVNRSLFNSDKIAKAYKIDNSPWENLPDLLLDADLVFSATASSDPVITGEMLKGRSSEKPLHIADMAVPRDVDPSVIKINQNIHLYDLEDFKHHLKSFEKERNDHLPEAQGIVEKQVELYLEWLHAQQFYGGIEALKREMHEVANEEVIRFSGSFRKSDAKALEALSHAILKRFIKVATHHLDLEPTLEQRVKERVDPATIEEKQLQSKKLSCREKRALRDGNN